MSSDHVAQFPNAAVAENRWVDAEHARAYLGARDRIPYRAQGMTALAEFVPAGVERVLDLGTGDGVTLALVRELRPGVRAIAADFSAEMLGLARERFAGDDRVEVVAHDLDDPLPAAWGPFDLVVSSFAIHHVADARKRTLFAEIHDRLRPGGTFLDLEHVASPTPELHADFLAVLGIAPADDDPSNLLAQVDCHWKWRELALLAGTRPA